MSTTLLPKPLHDALSPGLNRLRRRYQESPLPALLDWWVAQLRSCLPQRWQQALGTKDAELWLRIEGARLLMRPSGAVDAEPLAELPLDAEGNLLSSLEQVLSEDLLARRRFLLLPPQQVLRRTLQLPAAARENLHTVLGFELDRQTPFRLEQVYFDSRVLPTEPGARSLSVELALVPRSPVEQQLSALGTLAHELDGVDAQSPSGRLGFNFLPAEQRRRRAHRLLWVNLGLVAASLLFLAVAMNDLVDNRVVAAAEMQALADEQRDAARGAAALRKSLEDAVSGANFLAVQKRTQPSAVELLKTLTEVLPDDTFIERLNLAGTTLTITGQSEQAARLVEKLREADGIREAALSGAIQPDARSGKDRFSITAQVGDPAPAGGSDG